uniref:Proline--tRNA ligase n=1 Tax=Glossina austeni TaxID=7395 RepID=A0A1A9UKH4_GLOAU
MRISQYYLATLKEVSSKIESISHQLMLRSGMICKVASGLYSWLPTGLRVLKKIKKIIRCEMNKTGAVEILMPIMHPASLWQKSGRYNAYGLELFNNKEIPFIGLALRDDHVLDVNKAEQLYLVKKPLKLLSDSEEQILIINIFSESIGIEM